jgi:hypothetical protein
MSQYDEYYLKQVRKLVYMANNALDEANSYMEAIEDPKLKEIAQNIIDNFGE